MADRFISREWLLKTINDYKNIKTWNTVVCDPDTVLRVLQVVENLVKGAPDIGPRQYGDQIDIRRIADKGFDGWARYLSKEPREHGRRRVGERMWRNSRNLVKPIVDAGWVDAGDDLTAPPGAYILDRQERVNCYGRFAYLEYLLPAKT